MAFYEQVRAKVWNLLLFWNLQLPVANYPKYRKMAQCLACITCMFLLFTTLVVCYHTYVRVPPNAVLHSSAILKDNVTTVMITWNTRSRYMLAVPVQKTLQKTVRTLQTSFLETANISTFNLIAPIHYRLGAHYVIHCIFTMGANLKI